MAEVVKHALAELRCSIVETAHNDGPSQVILRHKGPDHLPIDAIRCTRMRSDVCELYSLV